MASGPITSWQIDSLMEIVRDFIFSLMETVRDFILGGSKITADGNRMKLKDACSLEEKL